MLPDETIKLYDKAIEPFYEWCYSNYISSEDVTESTTTLNPLKSLHVRFGIGRHDSGLFLALLLDWFVWSLTCSLHQHIVHFVFTLVFLKGLFGFSNCDVVSHALVFVVMWLDSVVFEILFVYYGRDIFFSDVRNWSLVAANCWTDAHLVLSSKIEVLEHWLKWSSLCFLLSQFSLK